MWRVACRLLRVIGGSRLRSNAIERGYAARGRLALKGHRLYTFAPLGLVESYPHEYSAHSAGGELAYNFATRSNDK